MKREGAFIVKEEQEEEPAIRADPLWGAVSTVGVRCRCPCVRCSLLVGDGQLNGSSIVG